MLDSLYGDLPPPTKGEEGGKNATTPAPSGSLLGSLYDDPDEASDSGPSGATPAASSPPKAGASAAAAGAAAAAAEGPSSSTSATWAAQRLQLLTPAVVRRQSLAKAAAAPKSSPALNVQAAAADTAVVLQRLKRLHAGVLSEEQKPSASGGGAPLQQASPAADEAGGTAGARGSGGCPSAEEPVVNVLSVTVGSSIPMDPTTWVPVGLWPQEYDPSKPNDYAAIHREKVRQQQREELERLRQQELDKQKGDEEAGRAGGESGESAAGAEPQAPVLPSYFDSNKKTFAARMMEKMGWKQGEGLGANKQGITAPLVARKTAMRSGVIVQGQEVSVGQVPRAVTFNMAPTRILLLLNMVGRGQVDADLKEETEEEAAKLGNLLQVRIFEAAGVPDDCAVRIFCEYERKEEATRALLTFNGRAFGGRTVRAKFYSEERFARGDLRHDPEQEVDQHVTVTI